MDDIKVENATACSKWTKLNTLNRPKTTDYLNEYAISPN